MECYAFWIKKNAPSEFQNIMNDIDDHWNVMPFQKCLYEWNVMPFTEFSIVYIDDVLIFSKSIDDHWKHLDIFVNVIKHNGLVVLATKINLFKNKIWFLGHNIYKGTLSPIDRAIQFADKFLDEIKDKNQLQRFLGSLNSVSDYFQGLRKICRPLYKRLEKNPPAWMDKHTMIVRQIEKYVKQLPCIVIPSPHAFKIVETDAFDIGYGGILK